MKLRSSFIAHDMKDETVLVDVSGGFSGVVRSNETAAFIARCLMEETTLDEVVEKMLEEYDVDAETARRDAERIIDTLRETGAVEE